jgi:sugar phosphate isomerase/epimerase
MKLMIMFLFILITVGFNITSLAQKTPEALGWKLCVGSYTFRLFSFAEALDKADSLGLKYIEMATSQRIGGGIEGTTSFTMDKSTQKAVLQLSAKHGIKIISYGVITGTNEAEWNVIFKFANDMGIQTLLSEPKTEQLDLVEKLAEKYKINVAIHNHPKPSQYWSPEAVLEAVNGRSKRIGSCADIGHWVRSGLIPLECLKKLEGRIIEFHFKDLNKKGDIEAHDVIWGTGVCDVKALIKEIYRQNYTGAVTIEYEYNWENSIPEIQESIKNFTLYTKNL